MPTRISPSLREYSVGELEALLQAIKSAISAREAAAEEEKLAARTRTSRTATCTESPAPAAPAGSAASTDQPIQAAEPPAAIATATPASLISPADEFTAEQQTRPAAEIKFMHPANRKMAWSGEGPRPEWIDAYLAQGGSWMALRNTAEKLAPRKR